MTDAAERVNKSVSSSYEIVILHKGLHDFARDVIDCIRVRTHEIYLQADLVAFKDRLEEVAFDSHVVVIYLGSEDGAKDSLINQELEDAQNSQVPILPLVRDIESGEVSRKLPPTIERLNAANWIDERGLAFDTLLRMLGLTEPERKVFLSYVRRDSAPMAEQLHTELVRAQFDVFLDRFSVPPAADFQKRIEQELADKAFVVLLESPRLSTSRWVEHEIAYAQSHRIGVLGITSTDTGSSQLVPSLDEAFRLRLVPSDVDSDKMLVPRAMARIIERIQILHAGELRRRREQLIGSLRDKLLKDGCKCEPVEEWALLATAAGKKAAVFLITPRRPKPEDLFELHQITGDVSLKSGLALSAAVVHEAEHIDEKEQGLMRWIGEPRELEAMLLRDCLLADEGSS